MSGFKDAVADWLRVRGQSVEHVVDVRSDGSDWDGDTEAGFHQSFAVRIQWVDAGGTTRRTEVGGEDMDSLWMHVVRAWPAT